MVSFFGRYTADGAARRRKSPVQSVITFIVAMVLLTVVVRTLAGSVGLAPAASDAAAGETPATVGATSSSSGYEPQFVLWPVLAVVALAGVAVVAWWLAARGRRQARRAASCNAGGGARGRSRRDARRPAARSATRGRP